MSRPAPDDVPPVILRNPADENGVFVTPVHRREHLSRSHLVLDGASVDRLNEAVVNENPSDVDDQAAHHS